MTERFANRPLDERVMTVCSGLDLVNISYTNFVASTPEVAAQRFPSNACRTLIWPPCWFNTSNTRSLLSNISGQAGINFGPGSKQVKALLRLPIRCYFRLG
ncbi:unnamed protein product [Schistocephalus solidus]|uniref:PLC-beta PH domain-containing protein n=1 Tax=Schistocephalus solidus TaxID=70667 RepID=A0A3P7CWL4_SCHSO|nr:unnamed protein product [Schistocephalus solidus]